MLKLGQIGRKWIKIEGQQASQAVLEQKDKRGGGSFKGTKRNRLEIIWKKMKLSKDQEFFKPKGSKGSSIKSINQPNGIMKEWEQKD